MGLFDSKNETTSSIPNWLENASKYAVRQGKNFFQDGTPNYRGERVADFTSPQRNAFSQIESWASAPSAIPQEAIGLTRGAATAGGYSMAPTGGTFKLADYGRIVDENGKLGAVSDYINPYTQNALDPAIRDIERAATAERMRLGDRAAGANAYGDARHGVMEGAVDRNRQEAIGDTSYRAFADAYNNAMGLRQADLSRFSARDVNQGGFYESAQSRALQRDISQGQFYEQGLGRQMAGAAQMQSIDTAGQQNQVQRFNALLGIGNQQQQQQQNQLDVKYQEWQERQQDEYDRLAALVSTTSGVPYSRTQTTTGTDSAAAVIGAAGRTAADYFIPG